MRPALVVAALVAVGCASGSSSDDPAAALADRVGGVLASSSGGATVIARLGEFGIEVTADELAAVEPLCPRVEDPEPGDEATCRITVGADQFEIDVVFDADGSLQVVDAQVAP